MNATKVMWDDIMHGVLRAYMSTKGVSTLESPLSSAFGMVEVRPTELNFPTTRTLVVDSNMNNELLFRSLDEVYLNRERSLIQLDKHHRQMRKDQKVVKPREFHLGDSYSKKYYMAVRNKS